MVIPLLQSHNRSLGNQHNNHGGGGQDAIFLLIVFVFSASINRRMVLVTLAAKECGINLAPSTIPGAGLGMFAGNKAYAPGDIVTLGDLVIPAFEPDWHNGH